MNPICSLSVASWDLAKSLRFLSTQTNLNIVLLSDPGVSLTLNLQNIPFKEMIRHICALTGLECLEVQGTYVFATAAKLRAGYPEEYIRLHPDAPAAIPAKVSFASYRPRAADPDRLADLLYTMFRSEHLNVVTGARVSLPQSLPPDTQTQASIHTGQDPNQGQGSGSTTQNATGLISTNVLPDSGGTRASGGARLVLIYGEADVVARALDAAKALDVVPAQVDIQVSVYEVQNDAENNLGVTWDYGQFTINESPNGFNFGTFTRTGLSFDAVINALETQNKAHTLARPNLSALDGTVSSLLIGDQLNYPDLIGYSNANTPIFGTKEVDDGISLQVSPMISDDGMVTMTIRPTVSTITGFQQINGASYPQLSTRKAEATIRVHSGETIVLGGLMNSQDIDALTNTPILSKIPVLGNLFKSRQKTHNKDELIITLTPKIMKGS